MGGDGSQLGDGMPRSHRRPGPTSFTVYQPLVQALWEQAPDISATELAARVAVDGLVRWFGTTSSGGVPSIGRSIQPTGSSGRWRRCRVRLVVHAMQDPAGGRRRP